MADENTAKGTAEAPVPEAEAEAPEVRYIFGVSNATETPYVRKEVGDSDGGYRDLTPQTAEAFYRALDAAGFTRDA